MKRTERIDLVCPVHGGPFTPEDKCCELAVETRASATRRRRNAVRRERDDAMRSLGLRKVRGALGGTYWE